MYNPNLDADSVSGNMYIAAVLLQLLETLAMEETFSQRLHELTYDAWKSLPDRFIIDFTE